jgi:hypothetical protein
MTRKIILHNYYPKRRKTSDAMTSSEREHYLALKRRMEYLQRMSIGSSGEDRRNIEAQIKDLDREMTSLRERIS